MADNEYYDEVDPREHERSRENTSVPDPASRDLWQSTTIATDGSGPRVEDVTPIFDQARAAALGNPITGDGDDESLREELADDADAAEERAEAKRETTGYVAPTGAEAGIFSDPALEGKVPDENFLSNEESEDAGQADDGSEDSAETATGGAVDNTSTAGGLSGEGVSGAYGDDTHSDLVSDTAGEQGGLDETSAEDATPKDETNTEANPPESTPEAPTSNA